VVLFSLRRPFSIECTLRHSEEEDESRLSDEGESGDWQLMIDDPHNHENDYQRDHYEWAILSVTSQASNPHPIYEQEIRTGNSFACHHFSFLFSVPLHAPVCHMYAWVWLAPLRSSIMKKLCITHVRPVVVVALIMASLDCAIKWVDPPTGHDQVIFSLSSPLSSLLCFHCHVIFAYLLTVDSSDDMS
jgi:hypothetical protein